MKWPDGFKCPKCGSRHCTVISGRRLPLYQCPVCRHQTSATAGTIMANTKLPLAKWLMALYFAATNKDGISEMALAKYIGVTLKTVWALLHKIRSAMGERENIYCLGGSVEMDEAFFGGKAAGKRGRGSENKTEVAIVLQLDSAGHPQFLKMQVVPLMRRAALYWPLQRAMLVWEAQSTAMHSGLTIRFPEITATICRNMIPKVEMDGTYL